MICGCVKNAGENKPKNKQIQALRRIGTASPELEELTIGKDVLSADARILCIKTTNKKTQN